MIKLSGSCLGDGIVGGLQPCWGPLQQLISTIKSIFLAAQTFSRSRKLSDMILPGSKGSTLQLANAPLCCCCSANSNFFSSSFPHCISICCWRSEPEWSWKKLPFTVVPSALNRIKKTSSVLLLAIRARSCLFIYDLRRSQHLRKRCALTPC